MDNPRLASGHLLSVSTPGGSHEQPCGFASAVNELVEDCLFSQDVPRLDAPRQHLPRSDDVRMYQGARIQGSKPSSRSVSELSLVSSRQPLPSHAARHLECYHTESTRHRTPSASFPNPTMTSERNLLALGAPHRPHSPTFKMLPRRWAIQQDRYFWVFPVTMRPLEGSRWGIFC